MIALCPGGWTADGDHLHGFGGVASEEIPNGWHLCFSTRKVIYVIHTINIQYLSLSTIKDATNYSFTKKEEKMQFFSSKQFRVTMIWVKKYSNLEKNKPPCFTAGPQRSDTFQNLILGYAEHFDPGNKACDCNCIASAINNYQKLMFINIYANVYIYIYMYRCMYIYMCVCIHICMCNMCVYIYFWQSKKPHILIDWLFGM